MSAHDHAPLKRSPFAVFIMATAIILAALAFVALGIWQLERRVWKINLIHEVDERIHAVAEDAPGPDRWAGLDPLQSSYRHIVVHGRFLNDKETLVGTTTVYGQGYWVMTPFETDKGFVVLINRGFVPPDKRRIDTRATGQIEGETEVTGLLRLTEPEGRFLRKNDPKEGRWYSRDVEAISASRGLSNTAPYFIDADDKANPGEMPIGGLTAVSFPNNHLIYAITWFGLAVLSLFFAVIFVRNEDCLRRS